jgi:cytoskeletal protein RodZ
MEIEKTFQNVIQNSKRNTRYRWFTIIILIIILSILVVLFIGFLSIWMRCYFKKDNSSDSDSSESKSVKDYSNEKIDQISAYSQKKLSDKKRDSQKKLDSLKKDSENSEKIENENEDIEHVDENSIDEDAERKVNTYKQSLTNSTENDNSVTLKFKKKVNQNSNNNNNNNNNQYDYFVNESFQKGFCLNSNKPSMDLKSISDKRQIPTNNLNFNRLTKITRNNR